MDSQVKHGLVVVYNGVETSTPVKCPVCEAQARLISWNMRDNGCVLSWQCLQHGNFILTISVGMMNLSGKLLEENKDTLTRKLNTIGKIIQG